MCVCELKAGINVKGRTCTYVVNEAEDGGYVAKCMELPQDDAEGETLVEVKKGSATP
jgi:hypothetical protein